ncbi:MAG TPA: hypothetical protein VKX40_17075 [Aequorivita sp.]|nr:hypothetical protein [Aequorivita sp.]
MKKQIKVVITKTTTLDELEKIKKQVIDEGLGFNYSNIVYNDNNEIISITIEYRDANNNSGNYSVSSKNPINNIVIVSDGGRISVKSEGSSNQAFISQGGGSNNSSIVQKSYEDQRLDMKEKSAQMEKEMEERMQEMKARQAAMTERMLKHRDSMLKNARATGSQNFIRNSNLITKNTTDQELLEIQKSYEADNIVFNYQNLQRNNKDEITHISITIDNQNGSVSTSGFGNGSEAIKDITVAVDAHNTIMKSAE